MLPVTCCCSRPRWPSLREHALKVFEINATARELTAHHVETSRHRRTPQYPARLHDFLAEVERSSPSIQSLWVFAPDGTGLATSRPVPPPRGPIVPDRDYFVHHRTHPGADYFVPGPLVGRTDRQPQFVLTRRTSPPRRPAPGTGPPRGCRGCSFRPRGRHRRVRKGQSIYRENDRFLFLYAVRFGTFKSTVMLNNGADQVTGFHLPGEVIGFDATVSGRHPTTAMALEDAQVCVLPYSQLTDACGDQRGLRMQVIRMAGADRPTRKAASRCSECVLAIRARSRWSASPARAGGRH